MKVLGKSDFKSRSYLMKPPGISVQKTAGSIVFSAAAISIFSIGKKTCCLFSYDEKRKEARIAFCSKPVPNAFEVRPNATRKGITCKNLVAFLLEKLKIKKNKGIYVNINPENFVLQDDRSFYLLEEASPEVKLRKHRKKLR